MFKKSGEAKVSLKKKALKAIIFWLHFILVGLPLILFLVPLSQWPERAIFQFWYMMVVFGIESLWGLLIYQKIKKLSLVCPLTSLMQYHRGYRLEDGRNHGHSFIGELLEKLGLPPVNFKRINLLMIFLALIIALQYTVLKII